jgi:hypothetical protein
MELRDRNALGFETEAAGTPDAMAIKRFVASRCTCICPEKPPNHLRARAGSGGRASEGPRKAFLGLKAGESLFKGPNAKANVARDCESEILQLCVEHCSGSAAGARERVSRALVSKEISTRRAE